MPISVSAIEIKNPCFQLMFFTTAKVGLSYQHNNRRCFVAGIFRPEAGSTARFEPQFALFPVIPLWLHTGRLFFCVLSRSFMKQFLFMLSIIWALAATAQSDFTLAQSIEYTLKHHISLSVYENNLAIAKEKTIQAVSGYLPLISGSATWLNNLQLQTTVLPAGILGPHPTDIKFGTKYNANAIIDVNQTIYDQSKITGIKASRSFVQTNKLQQEQNNEVLMYNTATAYFQVLVLGEQLKILRANKYKYEEMLKVLQYQYEKGTILEKDVDRIKVNLNATNYQIEDANTKYKLAINTLKNAMGMPLEQILSVSDSINYELFITGSTNDSLDLDALTEVKLHELSVEIQKFNLKTRQGAILPTVNAVGRFGRQALNNNFLDAFSGWNGFSYIGVSLNMSLFTGFKRKSMITEEKLKLKNEELNVEINKKNLKLRFDNSKTSVGTAYSSYKINKDNMELAQKLLSVTDYQYLRGVANLTDYLNDDAAYKAAQSNYISSLYNLMISQLDYQKSKGSLIVFLKKIE